MTKRQGKENNGKITSELRENGYKTTSITNGAKLY